MRGQTLAHKVRVELFFTGEDEFDRPTFAFCRQSHRDGFHGDAGF
jgi:hypothetical protein